MQFFVDNAAYGPAHPVPPGGQVSSASTSTLTPGARNYWKTHDFTELSDAAISTITSAVSRLPGPECEVFIAHVGGAMSRVPTDATAYPHRGAHFIMNVHTRWREARQDSQCIAWARELFTAAAPFATGSGYVNFMPADEPEDYDLDVWAGVLPISVTFGSPVPDPQLRAEIPLPAHIRDRAS